MNTKFWMKIIGSILVCTFLTTSCSSNSDTSFCNAAKNFSSTTSGLDINNAASIFGPDFWDSLSKSIDDLKVKAPDEFKSDIGNLENELDQFTEKLKTYDYNLLAAIIDPELFASFTGLVDTIQKMVETELSMYSAENCD
jgi:hypothetical protein